MIKCFGVLYTYLINRDCKITKTAITAEIFLWKSQRRGLFFVRVSFFYFITLRVVPSCERTMVTPRCSAPARLPSMVFLSESSSLPTPIIRT